MRQVIDTARGLEGLIRQAGVHAAGVIMSSEPIIDHVPVWKREADGAVITQFDYPACESLGLLKMDFLGLRNLTVLDDAVRGVKANRGIDIDLETLALDDKPTYDLLARGRHAGHLPVRRRPDAGPAAQHAAGQLRGHLGGRRALPARPDGRQRAQRLRRPEEPPQAGRADPPRAGRAAGRHPGRHLRADRLPGAGHGHRAEGGRVQPGQRGPAPPGHGQEEEGDPGQGVRAVRGRDEGQRLLRLGDQDPVGHPGPVLRLRLQQGAQRRLRAGLLLDRLPQGQLPGRVHGRAAHVGVRRQGQERAVPERVPPDGHHRPAPRTSTRRRPPSPRWAATSGSAWPRSGTSAPTWWTRSSRRARPRTRSPASPTSCARSRSTCATSGSSSR